MGLRARRSVWFVYTSVFNITCSLLVCRTMLAAIGRTPYKVVPLLLVLNIGEHVKP